MTLVCLLVVGAILVSSGCAGGVRSCGRRISENLVARVVGGHAASFGEIPWQASIQESRLFGLLTYRKCGAVVIHQNWLVTAAHCTTMWVFSELHITIGEHEIVKEDKDRKDINKKGTKKKHDPDVYSKHTKSVVQRRKVKRIISHPMFSPLDLEDDIALIELDKPLEFGPNIQPICLPNKNADFTRQEGIVSGWGFTAYRKYTAYCHCTETANPCRLTDPITCLSVRVYVAGSTSVRFMRHAIRHSHSLTLSLR